MEVRTYDTGDEESWLRCRILSFLGTSYYDDVVTVRPEYDEPSISLVAVDGGTVVGLLDLTLPSDPSDPGTIETIAVHPDHQRRGIGTALVRRAVQASDGKLRSLEAWTRDDEPTLRWYRSLGFAEDSWYLHVYIDHDEQVATEQDRLDGMRLVKGFLHCDDLGREAELRERFRRVHVCRRMAVSVEGAQLHRP